jgi:hypothetical protein
MWKILLLLVFALPRGAQPALNTIQDTLYNADGSLMNGNIIVANAAFSVGGVPVAWNAHVCGQECRREHATRAD